MIMFAVIATLGIVAMIALVTNTEASRRRDLRWLAQHGPATEESKMSLDWLSHEQGRVRKLQRIVELPDAFERLLADGYVYMYTSDYYIEDHPSAAEVRIFMKRNGGGSTDDGDAYTYSLPYILEWLHGQEARARDDLYAIAVRSKPMSRAPRLIEQRAKVEQLEHQLAAERQVLEKLEIQAAPPDPYGRLPTSREESRVAEPEPELAEITTTRKKRA